MAYTVPRTDKIEFIRDRLPDGRTVIVEIDRANIRELIRRAQSNKTGRAAAGPVVVTIK